MDLLTVIPLENGSPGFRLVGELDMSTAPVFAEALAQVDPDVPLTLDLSELTFIDSTGVQAIFAHALSADRKLVLDSPSPEIVRTLEILGIAGHSQLDVRPAARAS
jgi:anti-anti-sigma factor